MEKVIYYVGWWTEGNKVLNTAKFKICPICKGSGASSRYEYAVRCFTCFGDGYVEKGLKDARRF